MNKFELENTALQLKALLTVLTAIDPDNETALAEIPHALQPAAALAEKLYCAITDSTDK